MTNKNIAATDAVKLAVLILRGQRKRIAGILGKEIDYDRMQIEFAKAALQFLNTIDKITEELEKLSNAAAEEISNAAVRDRPTTTQKLRRREKTA